MSAFKRPLAVISFTYLLTAAVCAYLPVNVCLFAGLSLGVFAVLAFLSRHSFSRLVSIILTVASIACVAVMLETLWRVRPAQALAEQQLEISGKVSHVGGPRSIELTTESGVIAVSSRETLDVEVGDSFSAVAALSAYDEGNPSIFARRKAKTVPLRGYVLGDYRSAAPDPTTLSGMLSSLKRQLSINLRQMLPGDEGKTLCSLLLGERQRVPQTVNNAFSASGLSHLLSVSGYHIAVMSGLFTVILKRLHVNSRLSALLTVSFLLFLPALLGFSPSITRAVVMAILHQLALAVGRKNDSLTALAVAGLLLCGLSPLSTSDVSFQLSFMATLGILLCSSRLNAAICRFLGEARFPNARDFFVSALSVTLCATLFTLPVIIFSFEQLALYAPITNLLVAPLVPVVLICGLVALLLSLLPIANIAAPFAFISGLSTTVLTAVSTTIAGLPFAVLPVGADFVVLWLAGAAVLVGLSLVQPSRKKFVTCGALCTISLVVGILSYQLTMRGVALTTILPTDGGVVMVAIKNKRAIIIGAINTKSDVYMVRALLRSHVIERIELLAVAPANRRRGGAICELFENYDIALAIMNNEDFSDERIQQASRDVDEVYAWSDMTIKLLGDDSVQIYGHEICANFSGIKTFLLTGNCGIIECTRQFGVGDVAVFSAGIPSESDRLRCQLIVTNGIYDVRQPILTTVLGDVPSAAYLAKAGRFKVS